jgi:hypothetical protein
MPGFAALHDEISHALLQEAAIRLAQSATEGLKVRQFDLQGREVGDYTRPAR